jgi:hypothetical protein
MKHVFRTLTLATVAVTIALGTAFAQTATTAAKPATQAAKPATTAKAPAATTVALKDVPAAVNDAIKAAYPKGTISKVTKTGDVYSVAVKDGKATKTVKVGADGKIQK